MPDSDIHSIAELDVAIALAERLEAGWRSGSPIELDDVLPEECERTPLIISHLAWVDLENRWRNGERPRAEDYLTRFPQLRGSSHVAEIVSAEYRSRRHLERHVSHQDYFDRFPDLVDRLRVLLTQVDAETPLIDTFLTEGFVNSSTDQPIIDCSTADTTATLSAEHNIQLPGYEFCGLLGMGAMGAVYAVHEQRLGRTLALKTIHLKFASHPGARKRFVEEMRITAKLQHPGIVPIHESGVLRDGRPYYVMKVVQGQTLSELLNARPYTLDNIARFLQLYIQVCNPIAYAHSAGIVHRDLKPSNIMVGAFGEVQVMDWGLAKDLNKTDSKITVPGDNSPDSTFAEDDETVPGTRLGTPAYWAPEQARGEVEKLDVRCDVFGLGGILCTILTGKPTFTGVQLENHRRAMQGDLTSTFERLDNCGADLELINLAKQCLSPGRDSRPDDGSVVAGLIANYISEVEERRREAELNRAKMEVQVIEERKLRLVERQKRRRTVGLAVSVALAFVIVSLALYIVNEQKTLALNAQANEANERVKAELATEAERKAKEQTQKRLVQLTTANVILGSIFEKLDPEMISRRDRPLQEILGDNLQIAVEQLDGEAIGDPLVVADFQNLLGYSLHNLGNPQRALIVLKKAHDTYLTHLGPDNIKTLGLLNNLAEVNRVIGKPSMTVKWLQEVLELQKTHLGPNHMYTPTIMNNLGQAYIDIGRSDLAEPLLEETVKLHKTVFGLDHQNTLKSMNNLALAYDSSGKTDLAVILYKETLMLEKDHLGPENPTTLHTMNNLAEAYRNKGKLEEAMALHEETLKLRTARLGQKHPDTLISMNNLASTYAEIGKLDLAVPLHEKTLKLRQIRLGHDHPDTLISMNNLAVAYDEDNKPELALPLFEETLKFRKIQLGQDHELTLLTMGNLAQCYVHTGKLDLAVQLFDETIKLRKGRLGLNDPDTYSLMNNLAQAYITIGKPDLAVSLHEKVLKFRADRLGHEDPGTLRSLNNLAVACCLAKQGEKAVPLFAEWIGIRRKVAKMDDPIFARQLAQVSLVLLNANQYSASEIYLRECLTILKKSEPDLWFTFHTESMLGQCLLAQKDYTHAKELLFLGYKGMKAREKNIPLERRAYLNDALDRLILFHVETNQPEEAAKLHKLRISEVAPTPHSVK